MHTRFAVTDTLSISACSKTVPSRGVPWARQCLASPRAPLVAPPCLVATDYLMVMDSAVTDYFLVMDLTFTYYFWVMDLAFTYYFLVMDLALPSAVRTILAASDSACG